MGFSQRQPDPEEVLFMSAAGFAEKNGISAGRISQLMAKGRITGTTYSPGPERVNFIGAKIVHGQPGRKKAVAK